MYIKECYIPPICIFYGFDEFFEKREQIRHEVDCMDLNQIFVYKLYVYSSPFITDYIRNSMWDFLMRDIEDYQFMQVYIDYKKSKKTI